MGMCIYIYNIRREIEGDIQDSLSIYFLLMGNTLPRRCVLWVSIFHYQNH